MTKALSKEHARFDALMGKLLTVPKTVVDERMKEHREKTAQNPRKRGPKRKV